MIHLIMPMGGAGSRFKKNGCVLPKPLIEINGKPFLYWATQSILNYVPAIDITFVVLQQHIDLYKIDQKIIEYFPNAVIKVIPEVLPGPVFTCLKGIEDIKDDYPIVFNDCDHMFRCDELNNMLSSNLDVEGVLVTFKSNYPHFSYVQYDQEKRIVGTIEKKVVSERAICGAYVFKDAELFRKIACEYTNNCPYNECFLSGMYNVICKNGGHIVDCLVDYHVEFGTPEEYELAKDSPYFSDLVCEE